MTWIMNSKWNSMSETLQNQQGCCQILLDNLGKHVCCNEHWKNADSEGPGLPEFVVSTNTLDQCNQPVLSRQFLQRLFEEIMAYFLQ